MKTNRTIMILAAVGAELERAVAKHPTGFHSAHEGYAVIKEELDELWDEVKADTAYTKAGFKEAIQVAAMAMRFIHDLAVHDPEAHVAFRELLQSYEVPRS